MNPLAFIMGPALPYVAGGLLAVTALGGWYINDRAYDRGATHCEAKHLAADLKAANAAATVARERDAAITKADTADALAKRALDSLAVRGHDTVKEYYRANPADNRACLPVDRLRGIADSDRAAFTAATAPSAGDAAVRDPALGERR